jgi:hypothetical protein
MKEHLRRYSTHDVLLVMDALRYWLSARGPIEYKQRVVDKDLRQGRRYMYAPVTENTN